MTTNTAAKKTATTAKSVNSVVIDDMLANVAKKAAPAKRRPAAKKAAPAKPKPAPAKVEPAAAEPKPLTRTEIIAELHVAGYPEEAPLSFTATTLRSALEWIAAGSPKDGTGDLPNGIVFAVHPHLKPAPKAKGKRLSSGYLAALADVLAVLDASGDVRTFVTEGLATGEASV